MCVRGGGPDLESRMENECKNQKQMANWEEASKKESIATLGNKINLFLDQSRNNYCLSDESLLCIDIAII